MPLRTETRTIDGDWFQVTQLPPTRSTLLLNRLCKSAGPAIIAAVSEGKGNDLSAGALAMGAGQLFQNLKDEDLKYVMGELFSMTWTKHGPQNAQVPVESIVDDVFADKMPTMFKVLGFALEVNYSSFFGGAVKRLVAAGKAAVAKQQSNSNSPIDSPQPGDAGA